MPCPSLAFLKFSPRIDGINVCFLIIKFLRLILGGN